MPRGFDQLATPTGILVVGFAMFLVAGMIIFGGAMVRVASERQREERRKMKEEIESRKP